MSTYYTNTLYPLQDKVLKTIDSLQTPFYLTGGTALSRCYFHHRYSDDLDLFVNNHPEFQKFSEVILQELEKHYTVTIKTRADTFYSLLIDNELKVDMVNDVASHIGDFSKSNLFSKTDTVNNILSNKISAVYSREQAKDVADIWIIATTDTVDWKQIFQDVSSKAAGIFPPLIAERLETFPLEMLEEVKWIPEKTPSDEAFKKDIDKIIRDMLNIHKA